MSLKTAIVDYAAFDGLKSREGLEGFLIGIHVGNKAFITSCFPLKEPWNLASMDLLSTGKTLNKEIMKESLKLIKKTKYLLIGGVEFMGFYLNCSVKDQKTYETKLVNPLAARLQQKNTPELITIYHLLENQNNIVIHIKGSSSEKIDQKSQNVFDSFVNVSSKIACSIQKSFKAEDFIETVSFSLNERANQVENTAIMTLDNTLIMNEQESLDYYLKSKTSNNVALEFHIEKEEPRSAVKEDAIFIEGEFQLKALVHKKATILEAKKILLEDFKGILKKRVKFLIKDDETEEILDEIVQETGVFPLAARDCVVVKKQQEFYNYRSFLNKSLYEFYLDNFLLTEAEINLVFQENSSDFQKFLSSYEKIRNKKESSKKMPEPKKTLEPKIEENVKFRPQTQPIVPSTPAVAPPENAKNQQEAEQSQYKYLFLLLIIIVLIGLRVILAKWF